MIEVAGTNNKGNETMFEIESRADGNLYCKRHKKIWCEHIEFVVKSGLDADDLWQEVTTATGIMLDKVSVKIPYCASLNVWPELELRETTTPTQGRLAALIPPDTGNPERLGILFPGEGRNVLRQMLHEWFVTQQFYLEGPLVGRVKPSKCRASSHAPMQQQQMQKNLVSNQTQWGERWLLHFTGMCYACVVIRDQIMDMVPSD